ncbi:glycosyltransferase [Alsobacter sp. R-9]
MDEGDRTGLPSWSLVVATYERPAILHRCLTWAASQTVRPLDVVVVDASKDYDTNASSANKAFLGQLPLNYVKAEKPSLTVQRNQGVRISKGEIVFLIDDDSLMFQDCAERILEVYALDRHHKIAGIMAEPCESIPGEPSSTASTDARGESALRSFAKKLLDTESTYFLPYDAHPVRHAVPPECLKCHLTSIDVMAGYAMTFRRKVFDSLAFSPMLMRYSAGEDQDFSYRASRLGALVVAHGARLHHLEVPGGRLSRVATTALADLNPAALQVLHADDLGTISRRWTAIVRKRLLIRFLKDLSEREFRFRRTRGTLISLAHLAQLYRCDPARIADVHGALQASIIDRYGNA